MKWAAAIFGVMLYVIWPYYTVLELSRAIQSGDAVMINRLVDWEQVRPSVKAQIQVQLEKGQNTVAQRELADKNPSMSKYVNAMTQKVASSAIDRMLTPEGIARLIEGSRERASLATASRQASAQPPGAGAATKQAQNPEAPATCSTTAFGSGCTLRPSSRRSIFASICAIRIATGPANRQHGRRSQS
jgi:hypothetical protein